MKNPREAMPRQGVAAIWMRPVAYRRTVVFSDHHFTSLRESPAGTFSAIVPV